MAASDETREWNAAQSPLERVRALLEATVQGLPPPTLLEEPDTAAVAGRLRTRLARDLLPRVSAAHPGLLVAIAGPNNAGKSTLFNALVGGSLSPARALGGLTRQALAVAHPDLWSSAVRPLLERRFEVRLVEPGGTAVVTEAGPPGRLNLLLWPNVPARGVLLMDLPDFDSIYLDNRQGAEAVLVTVDLLLFVVTRQTYQNAALVLFLQEAVGRGKPYALVYNEATSPALAGEHLAKLASDVGTAPLARYYCRHDPRVERGEVPLKLEPLDGGPALEHLLADAVGGEGLKTRALEASLHDAMAEMTDVASRLRKNAAVPDRLRQRLRHELRAVGERAARKAVPADVLVEAFRDELDARSPRHRIARWVPRKVSNGLSYVGRAMRSYLAGPEGAPPTPAALSSQEIADGLRRMQSAFAPELAAWNGDAPTRAILERSLGSGLTEALERPLELDIDEVSLRDRESLYRFSRQLLAKELPGGVAEEMMQTTATAIYFAPALLGGAAAIVTGGLGGHDVVWVGTLVTTPVLEKLVDRLGKEVREAVVKRWVADHGETMAVQLERKLFSDALSRLDHLVTQSERSAALLEENVTALKSIERAAGGFAALLAVPPSVPPEGEARP